MAALTLKPGYRLYRDCPLLRDSNDLVLSIVERDLIQCPLFGVSVKRDSTVHIMYLLVDH